MKRIFIIEKIARRITNKSITGDLIIQGQEWFAGRRSVYRLSQRLIRKIDERLLDLRIPIRTLGFNLVAVDTIRLKRLVVKRSDVHVIKPPVNRKVIDIDPVNQYKRCTFLFSVDIVPWKILALIGPRNQCLPIKVNTVLPWFC